MSFYTKTLGNSEPPSAPKADPVKGVKKLREAKHWEQADQYSWSDRNRAKTIAEMDEEFEVTAENIYNGDDWQEDIADAVINHIVDPIFNVFCCCFKWECCFSSWCVCNNCCCGQVQEEGEVEEYYEEEGADEENQGGENNPEYDESYAQENGQHAY